MKKFILLIPFLFLFIGCSSKQYFEPKSTQGRAINTINIGSKIVSFNKDVANLQDGRYITKNGISKEKFKNDFSVLNEQDGVVIASDKSSTIAIKQNNEIKLFNLENPVVGASIQGNKLAVIFWDNSIALYDILTKKFIYKEYLNSSLANDIRIANPKFLKDIVLFPSLDGKLVAVGLEKNEKIKDILVDAGTEFNNLIHLEVLDNMLIGATKNKIISIGSGFSELKEYEIVDIIINNGIIYLATLDGQIISLNSKLEVLKSKKYKFAKIVGLCASNDYIYILESTGYLIKLKNDFSGDTVYTHSIYSSDKIFSNANNIVVGDTIFSIK